MKGTFNIKIFIEEIHRQVDLTNGSFSFKPLHFVHTIHIHVCLLSVFQAWREKSLCGRAKKNWSRGGFFFLQRWDYTFSLLLIIFGYCLFWLFLFVTWIIVDCLLPLRRLSSCKDEIILLNISDWHFVTLTPLMMLRSKMLLTLIDDKKLVLYKKIHSC